jgi:hypothetical protein
MMSVFGQTKTSGIPETSVRKEIPRIREYPEV